jgi:hypothetical protein
MDDQRTSETGGGRRMTAGRVDVRDHQSWWPLVPGASWKHPDGHTVETSTDHIGFRCVVRRATT